MRGLLALAAAVTLAVTVAGCGSIITVPDQGVVVLGCRSPAFCYAPSCDCTYADANGNGKCIVAVVQVNPLDPSTWVCPANATCQETAQACVGRGAFCGGAGARCLHVVPGQPAPTCSASGTGDPPMLISAYFDGGSELEPHCQYTDDVCCPGTDDGGA